MNSPVSMIKNAKDDMKRIDELFKQIEHTIVCEQWKHLVFPCGKRRYADNEWEKYIKTHLVDEDIDFQIYVAWCMGGCGADFMLDDHF